jgi:hypothetical protein
MRQDGRADQVEAVQATSTYELGVEFGQPGLAIVVED